MGTPENSCSPAKPRIKTFTTENTEVHRGTPQRKTKNVIGKTLALTGLPTTIRRTGLQWTHV